MRNPIAERIAARRLAIADRATADKNWDHFQTQAHLLASGMIRDIQAALKVIDQAHAMRKMAQHGEAEKVIKNAHDAVDDAMEILDKNRALSGMATAMDRLRSPVIRADQEAYGMKI